MREISAQLFPRRICGYSEIPRSTFSFKTANNNKKKKKSSETENNWLENTPCYAYLREREYPLNVRKNATKNIRQICTELLANFCDIYFTKLYCNEGKLTLYGKADDGNKLPAVLYKFCIIWETITLFIRKYRYK